MHTDACDTHACTYRPTQSHTDACTLLLEWLLKFLSNGKTGACQRYMMVNKAVQAYSPQCTCTHTACTGGHKPSVRVREKGTRPSLLVQSSGEITWWHLFHCCSFTHFLGPFFLLCLLFSLLFKFPFSNAFLSQWKEHKLNGTGKEWK